jgi:hypothetical protein
MSKVPSIEELDEKIQQRVNYLAERDPQICTLRGAKEMLLALHDNGQDDKEATKIPNYGQCIQGG